MSLAGSSQDQFGGGPHLYLMQLHKGVATTKESVFRSNDTLSDAVWVVWVAEVMRLNW